MLSYQDWSEVGENLTWHRMLDGGTGKEVRNDLIEAIDASSWNAMSLKGGVDMTMP
jgi:hypothetical protein